MKKIGLLFIFIFFCSSINSQTVNAVNTKLPKSIYIYNNNNNNVNNNNLVNNISNISSFNKHLYSTNNLLNPKNMVLDSTNLSLKNHINKNVSSIIYDTKRYLDLKLTQDFLLKNDPTRWCPANFKSYSQLKREL